VGINNYLPLADWRDGDYAGSNPDGAAGPCDPRALQAAISSGERYDWYYASDADRRDRVRTSIGDGAYGKPWVFRAKDMVGWWSNPHINRPGGVEAGPPTAWMPRSKPIWFTEVGCAAADKGPDQPNVFPDPKSVEDAKPYFSNGGRSDLAQRRFLEAHLRHWDPAAPDFDDAKNPVSDVNDGRMVDHRNLHAWAWDARPFPAFPRLKGVWADGDNWHRGHWLNGRLDGVAVSDVIDAVLAEHGLPTADTVNADGTLAGYVVEEPATARGTLEPLIDLFGLIAQEEAGTLVVTTPAARMQATTLADELVLADSGPAIETIRLPDHDLPAEIVLSFRDGLADHQTVSSHARHDGAASLSQAAVGLPATMEKGQGQALADEWMARQWTGRETAGFAVPAYREGIEPGKVVRLEEGGAVFLVTQIEDGAARTVKARRLDPLLPVPWLPSTMIEAAGTIRTGRPHALLLDLPSRSASGLPQDQLRIAAWHKPWKSLAVLASPETTGFVQRTTVERPADLGILTLPLSPGFEGRVHRAGSITVALFDAEAASVSRLQMLNGANAAAIRSVNDAWEIVQFEHAEEISVGTWRLSGLLRGQLGTTDALLAGADAGADFVMLDDSVRPAGLAAGEIGLPLIWRIGPAGEPVSADTFVDQSAIGGLRAILPLAPVHLKCRRRASGTLEMSWTRRGRLDADDWAPADIPLGEAREEYRVTIAAAGGSPLRTATATAARFDYDAAMIAADFGTLPAALDLTVAQFSLAAGWGLAATRRFSF